MVLPSVLYIDATLRQVSATTCNLQMTRSTGKDKQEGRDHMEQDHRLIIPPSPPMVRDHLKAIILAIYFVLYLRTIIFDQEREDTVMLC